MGGVHPIREILRIDNVETQPAERITANDEERQTPGVRNPNCLSLGRPGMTASTWKRPLLAIRMDPSFALTMRPVR
jgi:hypothetical protein